MRVLLVEDDRMLAEGLRGQLEKAGFSVDSANTAREARLLGEHEDYRVGILDLGLPDGNGLDENRQILKADGDQEYSLTGPEFRLIAAVRQILEDTSRPLDEELRREMASRLDDIDNQLEAEMRRSRFAGPQVGKSAHPVKQARDLL